MAYKTPEELVSNKTFPKISIHKRSLTGKSWCDFLNDNGQFVAMLETALEFVSTASLKAKNGRGETINRYSGSSTKAPKVVITMNLNNDNKLRYVFMNAEKEVYIEMINHALNRIKI